MIAGNEERHLITILGPSLQRIPQFCDVLVVLMRRLQHQVVAPRVSPIVRLAIADEKRARAVRLQIIEQILVSERVKRIIALDSSRGFRRVSSEFVPAE